MATVLRNESIDVSMELYSTLVPHVFSPNIDFYRQLIQEIDIQKGHNHLPKIWIDLGASNFTGLGNSKIEQKMQIMERFAASMQYADLEIFSDFDDGENESKLILLQVYNRFQYIDFKVESKLILSTLKSNFVQILIFYRPSHGLEKKCSTK